MPSQKIGLGNVSKMTYFVLSGMQNLNSINQSNKQYQSIKMLVKFFDSNKHSLMAHFHGQPGLASIRKDIYSLTGCDKIF